MPIIMEQKRIPRKLHPIIYVLETSENMAGDCIASVNAAMDATIEILSDISKNNPTFGIQIGVLQFSSGAKWITDNGFAFVDEFFWNDLSAGGLSDFGSALNELDDKLSRSKYLDSYAGYNVPVIIFMIHGEPTDDYEAAWVKVNANNKWFKIATKIAIAVGDNANVGVLEKIVGNREAILKIDDHDSLINCIKESIAEVIFGDEIITDLDACIEIINSATGTNEKGGEISITSPITGLTKAIDVPTDLPVGSSWDDIWGDVWE